MKRNIYLLTSLLMVAMLFAACAPQGAGTDMPATSAPSVHGDPTEAEASLMKALQEAGAKIEFGDSVEQPFFSVTGQIIKVNGAEVQVFEYLSPEVMEADVALVAPDGGSVGTSMMMWMATPHFFKSGRVLVLYIGDDAATLDLLKSVLGEQFAGR